MVVAVTMRRISIGIFCCAIAIAVLIVGLKGKKKRAPDVFLVTIDTLRSDHVHCYGDHSIQTPAIDRLADDGIRFAQAFTSSPITNTSHVTIMTGLLPSSHGVTNFGIPLDPTHATWAQLLKQRGYHTAAFIGAVILDSNTLAPGLNRGFDFYDNFPQHSSSQSRWGRLERRGTVVVQHAKKWLDENPAGPHFVWVHLYDPHDPYEPPPPYSEIYKDHLYDGEIAYADSALANFMAYLKKHRQYDNAIIIVVGDHGEGLGEHHEETHGIFLYDSTTHVPLIVKLPGEADAGRVVDAQVRTTDILPTVLDLLHVPAPAILDGASLRSYFAGPAAAGRPAFGETDYPLQFGWAPLRSLRRLGFKFIEAPRPELYNLQADPGELKNLYQQSDTADRKSLAMLAELSAKIPSMIAAGESSLPDPKDKIEQQNLFHAAMQDQGDGRPNQARQALNEVLKLDPQSLLALRQLGELDLQTGDYANAAAHLKRARELSPDDPAIGFDQGKAFEKMGDLAKARGALQASLTLAPGQLPARLLLGRVFLNLRDAEAAEDQFDAVLLLEPDSVEAQVGLAQAQIAEGRFASAIEQLAQLSKSQPGNAEVREVLAQAYSGMGKKQEAEQVGRNAKPPNKKHELR